MNLNKRILKALLSNNVGPFQNQQNPGIVYIPYDALNGDKPKKEKKSSDAKTFMRVKKMLDGDKKPEEKKPPKLSERFATALGIASFTFLIIPPFAILWALSMIKLAKVLATP